MLALVTATLFVDEGAGSWARWTASGAAILCAVLFAVRERSARHPLLDLGLIALPLVSSGLLFKAAAAVTEPFTEGRLSGLIGDIGTAYGMTLGLVGSGGAMLFLSVVLSTEALAG